MRDVVEGGSVAGPSRPRKINELLATLRWPAGAAVIFAAMVFFLLGSSLFGGKILSSGNAIFFLGPFTGERPATLTRPSNPEITDPLMQFQPDLLALNRELGHGELGLWTADQAGGRPLWASQQTAALFPLTWLAFIFSFWHALAWIAALKLCVAALGAYALGRWTGLQRGPAALVGVSYAFCAYMTDGLQFPTAALMSVAPWTMLMAGRVARRGTVLDTLGLVIAVGLILLTGLPEMIAIALGGVVFYALYELLRGDSISVHVLQPSRWRRLGLLVAGGIGGIALSGAAFVPFVEFLGVANSTSRAGVETYPNSISYAFFFPELWGRPDKAIGQFGPINYTERTAYLGALPLLLAFGGVFARRPRREHLYWTLFTVAVVLISMHTFLHSVVSYLPGPNRVKLLRTLCLVELGGSILAGFGLQVWLQADKSTRRRMMTSMVVAGLIPVIFLMRNTNPFSHFAGVLGQLPSLGRETVNVKSFIKQIVAWRWLLFGGLGLGLLGMSKRLPRRVLVMAVLVLVAVDLTTTDYGFNPQISLAEANPPTPSAVTYVQSHVGDQRVSGMTFPGSAELPANLAERYGLRDIETYDFPETERWARLWSAYGQSTKSQNDWNAAAPRSHAALNAFAVKYVFPPSGGRGPTWLRAVRRQVQNGQLVLENTSALPRAWVAYDWRSVSDEAMATAMTVASGARELQSEPILEGVQSTSKGTTPPPPSQVEFLGDHDEQVKLRASVERRGYLILDDSYYPGWEALIDGHSTGIVPANENFRAVAVTPGIHIIDFRYRPTSFRIGAILSFLVLLVVLVGLCAIGLVRLRGAQIFE
jgi:hypothetical protein